DIARNFIIACTCDAFVAVDGAYGTLTEIGYAIQLGKRVVGLESWGIPGVVQASTPEEAVDLLFEHLL
ncbi:MAG: TIGR00725 family protein, partial [bacterium]